MYAIVDIETTGGFSASNRITEVAVMVHDGHQVVEEYHTLINPERTIPDFITGLTGINAGMVENAPVFSDIASVLFELLSDKIFVAHNVNFDFVFLKEEFQRVGMAFNRPKLCTVKLGRQICPGLKSYSLGRICEHAGITISDRHRAFGDAAATAELFSYFLAHDNSGKLAQALKRNSGEAFLPPQLSMEKYLSLPGKAGVYYFHDARGQVIYVGKANNIRNRFKGHFGGGSKSSRAMKSEIHDVTFQLTGSEFLALLIEALEIKRLWPKFNRSQKVKTDAWGIYSYEDAQGYMRLQISKIARFHTPIYSLPSHAEAWSFLLQKIKEFSLCPRLCGIQKTTGACYAYQESRCDGACCGNESRDDYNGKIDRVLLSLKEQPSKILIREKGRNEGEQAAMLFEQGVFTAYGFIDRETTYGGPEEVIASLSKVKSVPETHTILRAYLAKPNVRFLEI